MRSDSISKKIIVNVAKYLSTYSNKSLTLAIAPVLFNSGGVICDAPLLPEGP